MQNSKTVLFLVLILASISIISASSSVIETSFNVFFENDTCILADTNTQGIPGLDLGVSYWVSAGSPPADSRNDCEREGGINFNGDTQTTCCPTGYSCSSDVCTFEPRNRCSDFDTQSDCEDIDNGHANLAANELETIIEAEFPGACPGFNEVYGDLCYEYLDCKCEWDDSASRCNPRSNHKVGKISATSFQNWDFSSLPSDINSQCGAPGPTQSGKCTFEFTYEGSCQDGDEFITRRWSAFYETPGATVSDPLDYCQDGSEIIPCERVVRLDFANPQSIIIAIVILILIYYFVIKRKR